MSTSQESLQRNIEKARNEHYYIHVTKKGDELKTSHIKLSGCELMFKKNPEFVYAFDLRHAGVPSVLLEYLVSKGVTETQAREFINGSYTATNYMSLVTEIQRELMSIPSSKKEVKKNVSLDYIISMKPHLDTARAANKTETEVEFTELKKARNKNDLESRLAVLEDEKVIDITHFDSEKKSGIKTIKRTKNGSRRSLSVSGNLSRVVYDFKSGVDAGIKALVYMGFTQDKATKIMNDANTSKVVDLKKCVTSPQA
jgi:hypothetical protein